MTQGLLTLLLGGKVYAKIVVGCGGLGDKSILKKLRDLARKGHVPTHGELVELAREEMGCDDCRVVLTESEADFIDGEEGLGPLYRETFAEPTFNPRWDLGSTNELAVVDMDSGKVYKGDRAERRWPVVSRRNAMSEIKTRLNEPVLDDDYSVFVGYWYVLDGVPKRSMICGHVRELKESSGAAEVRRCDAVRRGLPLR